MVFYFSELKTIHHVVINNKIKLKTMPRKDPSLGAAEPPQRRGAPLHPAPSSVRPPQVTDICHGTPVFKLRV